MGEPTGGGMTGNLGKASGTGKADKRGAAGDTEDIADLGSGEPEKCGAEVDAEKVGWWGSWTESERSPRIAAADEGESLGARWWIHARIVADVVLGLTRRVVGGSEVFFARVAGGSAPLVGLPLRLRLSYAVGLAMVEDSNIACVSSVLARVADGSDPLVGLSLRLRPRVASGLATRDDAEAVVELTMGEPSRSGKVLARTLEEPGSTGSG
jgi:hypothetical protein